MHLTADHYRKILQFLILLLFVTYIFLLVKTAWLGDDAYITFRTIDNFVNGYGLRWNIAERVQSFTHPLWLLLLSGIYFFSREIFITSLIASIVISISAVVILTFRSSVSQENKLLVLLALVFSKAFIDYSTSGLENPLTNLLLVLFAIFYLKGEVSRKSVFLLSFLSSLILINRIDSFLLIFPGFVYYVYKNKGYKNFSFIILGFSPFILWELFSVWYYGFPFPNTAYAKLSHGISQSDIFYESLKYYQASFLVDPLTLSVIFLSIFLCFLKRTKILFALCFGIILYLVYVVWIGGDFMVGRFFTAPFIVSLIIIINIPRNKNYEYLFILLIVIFSGSFSFYNTITKTSSDTHSKSIVDERLLYYRFSNLLSAIEGKEMPTHNWVTNGKSAKEAQQKIVDLYSTGFFGFYVGTNCYIIDKLGLCDPLLSKLPCEIPWRIGHYRRRIPEGYKETLESGVNQIQDQDLSKYYDKIVIITRGDLWDLKRLKVIWKLNFGQFNYLLDNYINSIKRQK